MGITDPNRKYESATWPGDVMFAATGVTTGPMLRGVRRYGDGAVTHSVVMRSKSGTVRYIEAHHNSRSSPWRPLAAAVNGRSLSGRGGGRRCSASTEPDRPALDLARAARTGWAWASPSGSACRRSSAACWRRAGSGWRRPCDFLDPTLRALLPDPSVLADMDRAAARLADAVAARRDGGGVRRLRRGRRVQRRR